MDSLSLILNAIAVPVLAVDAGFCLVAANPPAQFVFAEIQTEGGFDELLATAKGLRGLLQDALTTGERTKAKINVGERANYSVTAIPFACENGQVTILATFEDRTGQADLKAMRQGFVANVSHEMRSPLTAISGIVETLQGPGIEDVDLRTKFLTMMAKEVTRMTSLVSDLLSLSQVEAKERLVLKKVQKPEISISQALETVATLATKHGKTLTWDLMPDLPEVIGRQDDLTRLFINLLENAILYSRENGRVSLIATIAPVNNPLKKDAILISVRDDGEGIAPQDIPQLTERFFRVDKSRSRHLGGTGLGLAIVKHILVRHQGKLTIESDIGKGSCFTVYLPTKN